VIVGHAGLCPTYLHSKKRNEEHEEIPNTPMGPHELHCDAMDGHLVVFGGLAFAFMGSFCREREGR
jgi:hypothetical protein